MKQFNNQFYDITFLSNSIQNSSFRVILERKKEGIFPRVSEGIIVRSHGETIPRIGSDIFLAGRENIERSNALDVARLSTSCLQACYPRTTVSNPPDKLSFCSSPNFLFNDRDSRKLTSEETFLKNLILLIKIFIDFLENFENFKTMLKISPLYLISNFLLVRIRCI